jgi:hypothetical protein
LGFLGLKTNHLATLQQRMSQECPERSRKQIPRNRPRVNRGRENSEAGLRAKRPREKVDEAGPKNVGVAARSKFRSDLIDVLDGEAANELFWGQPFFMLDVGNRGPMS